MSELEEVAAAVLPVLDGIVLVLAPVCMILVLAVWYTRSRAR